MDDMQTTCAGQRYASEIARRVDFGEEVCFTLFHRRHILRLGLLQMLNRTGGLLRIILSILLSSPRTG